MDLKEKNKQIHIDQEALSVLAMVQEGILSPLKGLMNQQEIEEINQTGLLQGCSLPSPLVLSPSGRKNEEVIQTLQIGEVVDLCVKKSKVGEVIVKEIFPINKQERLKKITGGDLGHHDASRIYKRLGNFAISGSYEVQSIEIAQNKERVQSKIKELNAKTIGGIMLNANPIHLVHEKILQDSLLRNDLLLIFLARPLHESWLLPYSLRLQNIQSVIENFLPSNRVLVLPLDYTYLFAGANRMIFNALICKNYGCTEFIASLGSSDLSTFYEGNQICTILDSIQGIDLHIRLLSEYIYCDICNTIKNTKICPHGKHHHISYDSKNLFELLKIGVLPPEVFIRKEVSSSILAYLFPEKAKKLDKLYYDLLSLGGILEEGGEARFYEKLSRLYRVK